MSLFQQYIDYYYLLQGSRRSSWLEAITPHLKDNIRRCKHYHVCQDHFKEDDLLLNNPIQLKDGKIELTPRYKISYRPSSVPTIFGVRILNIITIYRFQIFHCFMSFLR